MNSLVIVHTGDGKGKTTAALGLVMRAVGWSKKVCIIQFLKSPDFECGEKKFCYDQNIEIYSTGIGYSWTKSQQEQNEALQKSWKFAKQKLADSSYDLVVMDEINHVVSSNERDGIITADELIFILKNRPENMNVVLTGRNACEKIINFADTVTEMKMVKHHYNEGVTAKKGIEF